MTVLMLTRAAPITRIRIIRSRTRRAYTRFHRATHHRKSQPRTHLVQYHRRGSKIRGINRRGGITRRAVKEEISGSIIMIYAYPNRRLHGRVHARRSQEAGQTQDAQMSRVRAKSLHFLEGHVRRLRVITHRSVKREKSEVQITARSTNRAQATRVRIGGRYPLAKLHVNSNGINQKTNLAFYQRNQRARSRLYGIVMTQQVGGIARAYRQLDMLQRQLFI